MGRVNRPARRGASRVLKVSLWISGLTGLVLMIGSFWGGGLAPTAATGHGAGAERQVSNNRERFVGTPEGHPIPPCYAVSTSLEDHRRFGNAVKALRGEVFTVAAGTRVRLAEMGPYDYGPVALVRVISGDQAGRTGWMTKEYLLAP